MIISTTASDRDLRYVAFWWRRKARDINNELTPAERARYAAGAAKIESARRARHSSKLWYTAATSGD